MDYISHLSGNELVFLASATSVYISQNLNPDEIDTLGIFSQYSVAI